MIQEKTLLLLGFDEIRTKIQHYTTCALSKRMAAELIPSTELETIELLLAETEDAVSFIIRRGSPPSLGVSDVTGALRHAGAGGVLSLAELRRISGLLLATRRIKQYCSSVDELSSCTNHIQEHILNLILLLLFC